LAPCSSALLVLWHPLPPTARKQRLPFSTRRTTKIPAASGKKQSNYYTSAYEVGKVVIQALQEYSLLPIYSVSSPTGNYTPWAAITSRSPFPNDAITGVSKLSDGVPRLKKYELDNHHQKSNQLRWVSFMNNDCRHVSWNWQWAQTRAPGSVSLICPTHL
jgi:hypothetical protein